MSTRGALVRCQRTGKGPMWFPSSKRGGRRTREAIGQLVLPRSWGSFLRELSWHISMRGQQGRLCLGATNTGSLAAGPVRPTWWPLRPGHQILRCRGSSGHVFLDFQKAFDTVSHPVLIKKLGGCGVDTHTVNWVANWLEGHTQRLVVDGSFSTWRDVGSGVPQGSVLGPALFNIFISDLDKGVKTTLFKFADDTKVWRDVGTLEGRNRLQSDLDRLQGWADENRMGFNTDKCKVMHLGRESQHYTYRLGNSLLVSAEAEKDLGGITDAKMNMGQQCGDAIR
uniref:Reverse transcriptase domain-containing protein n=1 Tax=Crocodylus porosus TaxID=8502 RepID=A0A7M4E049_CROPO